MHCSLCENPVQFICKFCGRLVCNEHRHFKPYIMGVYDENNDTPQVIVVEDAAWCGKCHPVSSSIRIPELE